MKKSLKRFRVVVFIAAGCFWLISSMFLVFAVRESSLTFLMCSLYAWLAGLTFFIISIFLPVLNYVEDKLEESEEAERHKRK